MPSWITGWFWYCSSVIYHIQPWEALSLNCRVHLVQHHNHRLQSHADVLKNLPDMTEGFYYRCLHVCKKESLMCVRTTWAERFELETFVSKSEMTPVTKSLLISLLQWETPEWAGTRTTSKLLVKHALTCKTGSKLLQLLQCTSHNTKKNETARVTLQGNQRHKRHFNIK